MQGLLGHTADPTSSCEKRRPVVEPNGDPLASSGPTWSSWSQASSRCYPPNSDLSDSFGSSAPEPAPRAPPPLRDVPHRWESQEASSLRPVRRFIPQSWKDFFHRWRRDPAPFLPLPYAKTGDRPSAPACPTLGRGWPAGTSSSSSQEPGRSVPPESNQEAEGSPPRNRRGQPVPPSYEEKLEAYNRKYSYMKSWPGLLRLLAGLELLFGGMAFACACAYIQRDYQWYNLYGGGLSAGPFGGSSSYGPMTPFVLVVASLAWLVTLILLVLGLTMYYRTILLDARWWPLAEFALNLLLFLLYLAAALVYVNDVNRGGLCYSLLAANPLVATACRVEGGQVAGLACLFLTTLLYLAGALACLKMWRHERARKRRDAGPVPPSPILHARPRRIVFQDEVVASKSRPGQLSQQPGFSEKDEASGSLGCSIPAGHTPKPHIIPDYVVKYPGICCPEEREKYKAVFSDQYAEYRELFREVLAALQKFKELESMMKGLPEGTLGRKERSWVSSLRKEYEKKKTDPAFLKKQERCEYLKKKLTHIKAQIQEYDRAAKENSMYF